MRNRNPWSLSQTKIYRAASQHNANVSYHEVTIARSYHHPPTKTVGISEAKETTKPDAKQEPMVAVSNEDLQSRLPK